MVFFHRTLVLKLQTWIYSYIRHSSTQDLNKSIPFKYLGLYLIFISCQKLGKRKVISLDQSWLCFSIILNRYLLCLKAVSPGFVFWSKIFVKKGEVSISPGFSFFLWCLDFISAYVCIPLNFSHHGICRICRHSLPFVLGRSFLLLQPPP